MPIKGRGDDAARQTARLLRAAPALRRDAPDGCLDEDALAALVSGEAGEQRGALLAHVAACARCRHAAAALSRVLTDDRIAAELPGASGRAWRRRAGWMAGLAAAAGIAAVLLGPPRVENVGTDYREPGTTTIGAPILIAPRGRVATVPVLIWTAVPRATRYRFRLYDTTGAVLWESEVTDTLAVVPGSIRLTAGASYLWKVEAKTGRGRWAASDLVEFTVRQPAP